jgi:two-component system, NarL family, invasion response regulator UvrY
MPLKILIVDDHPIVVSGFKALLESEPDLSVIEAASAAAAERLVTEADPDIAVIDINLPGLSGFELTRRLRARAQRPQIVIFSMNDDTIFIRQAMDAGAKGFVSKNDNPTNMLKAIRLIAAGGVCWPPGTTERLAYLGDTGKDPAGSAVSPRDAEILRLLVHGRSLSEIAELVGVSYKTVAGICASLRMRFSARTQMELVRIAIERRLV